MPRPTTLPEPWRTLAVRLGGVYALALALYSDERTVRRWARRERLPRGPAVARIAELFRRYHMEPPPMIKVAIGALRGGEVE